MRLLLTLSFAGLLAVNTLHAQKSAQKVDTVFFEDFNENTLDRTKWNVEVTGETVNDEQQAYVDSASTISLAKGAEADGKWK